MADVENVKQNLLERINDIIPKVGKSMTYENDERHSKMIKNLAIAYHLLNKGEDKYGF